MYFHLSEFDINVFRTWALPIGQEPSHVGTLDGVQHLKIFE